MQLTLSQKQAVEYNDGPLLIIAGAGTGKTTVLVEKVNYLIDQKRALPEEILALTFTEKAAQEMQTRVDISLPYGYSQMFISTFHSFCEQILRNDAAEIGLSPGYKLYTQAQMILFFKQHLFAFKLNYYRPLGNPNKFIESLIHHFSRLHDEDISPEKYTFFANDLLQKSEKDSAEFEEGKKYLELAEAYDLFEKLKAKENIMDFSDLIANTLLLFRKRKHIVQKYKKQFKYIMVDEFQDTNIAQYELIKLLAPSLDNPRLTVIGDDNQSIYKFRGASISNILTFMDDYPKAKNIILIDNYRSYQKILDTSYNLITQNNPDTLEAKLHISKNLLSSRGKSSKECVEFKLFNRIEGETDFVAKEIIKLKKNYEWSDIAILIRANNHAEPFVQSFNRFGIPYQFLGPGMLFKQPEVKELIAFLEVLADISDSAALYRLLCMDIFDVNQVDVSKIIAFTGKTNLSLFESIEIYLSFYFPEIQNTQNEEYKKYLFLVTDDTKNKLFIILKLLKNSFEKVRKETAGQLLYGFMKDTGYLTLLSNYKTAKDEKRAINITNFFNKLKSFEMDHEDASVYAVTEYIKMSMEMGESPYAADTDWSEFNAVNILTVHAAKGLEFPVVFLVNLTSDRFPTRERRETIPIPEALIKELLPEGNFHIQEERRLFYVAMTRAKDKVYMTSAHYYGEGKRERKISPFVYESLGQEAVTQQEATLKVKENQISLFDWEVKDMPIKPKQLPETMSLSYSQIETYQTCPLKYKYQYVLRIPTSPNAAASFGETIHSVFQKFYEAHKNKEKVDYTTLLELYELSWIPMGYTTKSYEKTMKDEGKKILKEFYDTYYRPDTTIIDLEKWFKIKIGNTVFVKGKIDRIDKIKDDEIEIIDYKTGKMPDEKKLKKNMQVSLYALAASEPFLYNKKIENITLTFYFLQNNAKVSFKKTQKEIHEVKEAIIEIADEIKQSNFSAKVGPWCDFCPFKINCEAWQ